MQAMRSGFLPAILLGTLLSAAIPVAAQDIDTLVTTTNRSPSTVADQISDPAEKDAFLNLYKPQDAGAMLRAAKGLPSKFSSIRIPGAGIRGCRRQQLRPGRLCRRFGVCQTVAHLPARKSAAAWSRLRMFRRGSIRTMKRLQMPELLCTISIASAAPVQFQKANGRI